MFSVLEIWVDCRTVGNTSSGLDRVIVSNSNYHCQLFVTLLSVRSCLVYHTTRLPHTNNPYGIPRAIYCVLSSFSPCDAWLHFRRYWKRWWATLAFVMCLLTPQKPCMQELCSRLDRLIIWHAVPTEGCAYIGPFYFIARCSLSIIGRKNLKVK